MTSGDIRMNWVLIIMRDNTVEYCHCFNDYFEAETRANEAIKNIAFITSDFPKYRQNERYYDEENKLSIGLYPSFPNC